MIRYYIRVSTVEQNIERQLLAYDEADEIYIDKMSGTTKERPELKRMLKELKKDDIVVVKSLDRLSRSTIDLLNISKEIEEKGAFLKIIDKGIETNTAIGKFFLTVLGAIAELEHENIRQRTAEGIRIAKEQGKFKGRKKGAIKIKGEDLKRFKKFLSLNMSITDLAKEFKVARSTVYRWIEVIEKKG